MKKALLIIACLTLPALADDSALVKAAKASGGAKKKSTKKVITNADVKKTAGTVTVLPGSKSATSPSQPKTPAKSPLLKQEEDRRAAEAATKNLAKAETKVKGLETDLARIEQSYYESNDPNYRDTTIKQRFDQTKKQLDDARKELADARDTQKRAVAATAPKS